MDIETLVTKYCVLGVAFRGYSPSSVNRYKKVLSYYQKFSQVRSVEQITLESLRAFFFDGMANRNWKPATCVQYRTSCKAFFDWCVKEGYMKHNPAKELEVPRIPKRLPHALSKQDALKLLEVVDNLPYENTFLRYRNHAIFSTFLFAGLRRKELITLRLTDINLENMTIFVQQGKGQKDRYVPICETLAISLQRYLDSRKKMRYTTPSFFVSSNKNVSFHITGLRMVVRQIKKAGRFYFHIHQLRHTFATLMLEGGCDIYTLSKMMGHSDIKTTTIYLSASVEHLRHEIVKHPLNIAA
jgi:site-specific recombinase XerD